MTEGMEIDAPNVQHKGEAAGSVPHPGTPENITPNHTTLQNATDHSDAPSSPQNWKRRECNKNIHELKTSLEEGPSHRLRKQPHVDYKLLDDPYSDDIYQTIPASTDIMWPTYDSMGGDEPKILKAARQSLDWPEWERAINSKLEQLTCWMWPNLITIARSTPCTALRPLTVY
jgi:hypothetical protein